MTLRWVILPRALRSAALPEGHLLDDAARFGNALGLLLWVALALVFLRQLLEFRDPFVPWREDAGLLLTGTAWGSTFLAAALVAVVVPFAFRIARVAPTLGWIVASGAVLALGFFPGLTGHANAGSGWLRASTLLADAAHVWAAGAWLGGLAGVLFISRERSQAGPTALPALVRAFSPVAVVSVGTLVATGLYASWIHVPSVGALLQEPYGARLLWKLGFVALVLLLGWRNWRRLTPRLEAPEGGAALRRSALLELAVAQLVLLVTAVLVRTSPPG